MKSSIGMSNKVKITLSKSGKEIVTTNMTCSAGREAMLSSLLTGLETKITHLSIGNGSSSDLETDISLVSELKRVEIDTINSYNNGTELVIYAQIPVGEEIEISEFGLFINGTSDLNSGSIITKTTINSLTKTNTEAMTIEWKIYNNNFIL